MGFSRDEVSALLVRCHRRCCICHRFCGVKIETDHIVPKEGDGSDDIDNAIPVCFECHAEIHSYNDKHPRGRKFQPEELRAHKAQWLKICAENPETLVAAIRNADVGPLQALVDELEFNASVAAKGDFDRQGCKFHEQQLLRAIHEGSISMLKDSIKKPLLEAYREMGAANSALDGKFSLGTAEASNAAQRRIAWASQKIDTAKNELLNFLSGEGSEFEGIGWK
jgi:hypothetical protein